MLPPSARGPFGRVWTAGLLVLDPVGVLIDADAAERARWGWWARRVGADPTDVLADAAALPSAAVVARHAPTADAESELAALADRLELLARTVRRTRGAAALLRALPAGRAAVWTRLDGEELSRLTRRARIDLPGRVLTGLGGADATGRAADLLAELGHAPERVVALEGGPVGAARSRAIGCRTVLVGATAAAPEGVVALRDAALVGVRPAPDGLAVSVRREPSPR